jgi:hydroxymethylglutaryl-CoA lyase
MNIVNEGDAIQIFEMGPRDGLQNEKRVLPLHDKVWLIESLAKAGVKDIEAGSFVRADKVPQMADSDQLPEKLSPQTMEGAQAWYLVPNWKGLERAVAKKVKNIAVFTAVSESFNRANIGMSVDESFQQIQLIVDEAHTHGMIVRGYVSTVWGCPFEGRITPTQAIPVLERLLKVGVDQLSVGDTIGVAAPKGVEEILALLFKTVSNKEQIAVHFHDTRGTALANALRAFEMGIRSFDSSIGGLGGCPFAPGAAGNLATEDLLYLFKEMGVITGIDYRAICELSLALFTKMGGKPSTSKALQAYVSSCNRSRSQSNAWDI